MHPRAPPIETVTLLVGFLCLTSGSETDEGVVKYKFFAELGIEARTPGPKPIYQLMTDQASQYGQLPNVLLSKPLLLWGRLHLQDDQQ